MAEGERAWFERDGESGDGIILHEFGRLKIVRDPSGRPGADRIGALPGDLTTTERIGLAVLAEEASERFARARDDMRFEGRPWGEPAVAADDPAPLECDTVPDVDDTGAFWRALAAPRLRGRIAVASFFVSGPDAARTFAEDEVVALQAQVKAGMALMNGFSPRQDLRFAYVIEQGAVSAPEAPAGTPTHVGGALNVEPFERGWRDAFLAGLGLPPGTPGLRQYAARLRDDGADWAFVNLFTKYRLPHHAYAMSYVKISFGMRNPWGAAKVFRVVAHEMGHIFGAPDEYGQCTCGGAHGPFGVANSNCVNCAGPGVDCLMRSNAPVLCRASGFHLGFDGLDAPDA